MRPPLPNPQTNKTVVRLNLSGNDFTAVGAGHLAEALSAPGCTLRELVLAGNPLSDAGITALGSMLG